jgi:putative lysine/arginine/ornithine/histidine/octopine transport system permease protein
MIEWVMQHYEALISGTAITLALMVVSLLIGFLLALVLALLKLSGNWTISCLVNGYITFFRGTPLLIQIFLLYYGLAQFDVIEMSAIGQLLHRPFICATIALALNSAAYTAVLIHGAIVNIPQGEVEAAKALAMPFGVRMRRIILPRAWARMLPAYSNEVIFILKGTSLVSTITLLDLMGEIRRIIAQTYQVMESLIAAGIIYLVITAVVMALFRRLERRQFD